jgi:hypothetical protein
MNPKERLVIDNFFSIGHFEWEINDFNILTGEMASGKSLCLKLVHFIEQILHNTIFLLTISKDTLTNDVFITSLSEKFYDVFHSINRKADFCNTKISYSYIYADREFDLFAHWNDDIERLEWDSNYIKDRIDKWRGFFVNGNSPDVANNGDNEGG